MIRMARSSKQYPGASASGFVLSADAAVAIGRKREAQSCRSEVNESEQTSLSGASRGRHHAFLITKAIGAERQPQQL
jgi:hypothetical protein